MKGDDADTIKRWYDAFTQTLAILKGSKPRIRQPSSFKRYKGQRGFRNTYQSSLVRDVTDFINDDS